VGRWRDIWLNEGFATWVEWAYAEAHGGPPAERVLRRDYRDFGKGDPFWHLHVANPGPKHLFDYPVYERGGMTLQALRHRIGPGRFATLLRRWVKQRAGQPSHTGQFERLAETVSGQDLGGFFDHWLRTGSRPAKTAANGLD
jgi:aminopeptidase N